MSYSEVFIFHWHISLVLIGQPPPNARIKVLGLDFVLGVKIKRKKEALSNSMCLLAQKGTKLTT